MSPQTIPASELPKLLQDHSKVIDVRTPGEFRASHVKGAELHTLDRLDAAQFCKTHGTDTPVYILCQSGKRASIAAQKLTQAGHRNAIVVEGGSHSAMEQGVEINQGKGTISIERQVRIVAGLLVLLGTLGGVYLHPGFLFVAGFVGAGLAFAGITDTCGMAMMLAKCPWNR